MKIENQLEFSENLHTLDLDQLRKLRKYTRDKTYDEDRHDKLKLIDIAIEGTERIYAREQVETWSIGGLESVCELLARKDVKTKEESILLDEILREIRRRDSESNFKKVSAR